MPASAHPVQAAPTTAPGRRPRHWIPRRVLVTAAAQDEPHGQQIIARCAAAGVSDIELLPANRLPGLRGPTSARPTRWPRPPSRSSPARRPSAASSRSRPAPTGGWISPRAARRTASTATSPARSAGRRSPGSTQTCRRSWAGSIRTSGEARSLPAPRRAARRARRSKPLLHRPPRHRAPHRVAGGIDHACRHPRLGRTGAAALHHEVRRRGAAARPAARRAQSSAVLGQRRVGGRTLRGRHRADAGADAALRAMALAGYPVGSPSPRSCRCRAGARTTARCSMPWPPPPTTSSAWTSPSS